MLNTAWGPLKLDQRLRLGLPPRARSEYKPQGDLTEVYLGVLPGVAHPSIWILSGPQIDALQVRLDRVGDTEEGRLVKAATIGSFRTVAMDDQGRISLPEELVEQAGIKEQVMLVGLGDRLEVWSNEALAGLLKSKKEQIKRGLEALFDLEAAIKKSNALGPAPGRSGEGSRPSD